VSRQDCALWKEKENENGVGVDSGLNVQNIFINVKIHVHSTGTIFFK
jgi:hypothetical protein